MIKVSDFVFDFVAKTGVRDVFLLPGGGCMHLVDSLGRHPDLTYHAMLHEQAAVIAADAFSQYTNHLGVALVTTGPGGTNALTGVAGSWLDSIPLLVISGQVKRQDITGLKGVRQLGFQELDIVSMARPVTKHAVTVMDPHRIAYEMEKAVHLATTGRKGPVWIDIPLDVQGMKIRTPDLIHFEPEKPDAGVSPSVENKLKNLLTSADRPIILAGNGIRHAGAADRFQEVIREAPIPVLTTWKAADFLDEEDSRYAGRPGSIGQRGANFALQNSDLLIAIGARLDFGQIGYEGHLAARSAKKIIVDIDEAEIRKLKFKIDLPVTADAAAFIESLLICMRSVSDTSRWNDWLERCKQWHNRYKPIPEGISDFPGYMDEYRFFEELSRRLTSGDVIVPGSSGACSEVTMQALKVKLGQRIFNTQGLGPMGFGLPAAIGASIASRGKRVVSVDGDGGFFMNIQELATIRRLNLPVKLFVLNNNGYGSIRVTQNNYFHGRHVASTPDSGLSLPDIRKTAEGFGIQAFTIERNSEISSGIRNVLETPGPAICELKISPEQATKPRVSSRQRSDGSFVSMPLEDLAPFLSRDEFRQNMIVPTVDEE